MNLATVLDDWGLELNRSLRQSRSFSVVLFSLEGDVLFANEAFTQLVGPFGSSSLINPTFDDLCAKVQGEACIFDGIMTLDSGKVINSSIEAQVYRKEGMLLIVGGANSLELLDQNIKLHRLNKEISGLERQLIKKNNNLSHLLEQIKDKNSELSQLISDKDLFLQIMAHDLRGPIGSTMRLSEMLCERFADFSPERVELMLETIYKSLDATFILLNDLLLWSKAQAGNLPYERAQLSANDICEEMMRLYAQNAKSIELRSRCEDDLMLYADAYMLKTIIRNLISNAVKFTPDAGRIVLSFERQADGVMISVKDTGVGMSAEVVNSLFDFTKRYTTEGTNGEKGSGLGLQLCYDFVRTHGGKLQVDSKEGEGTRFYFSIPQGEN